MTEATYRPVADVLEKVFISAVIEGNKRITQPSSSTDYANPAMEFSSNPTYDVASFVNSMKRSATTDPSPTKAAASLSIAEATERIATTPPMSAARAVAVHQFFIAAASLLDQLS